MRPDKPTDPDAQIEALWTANHHRLRAYLQRKTRGNSDHASIDDAIVEAFLRLRRTLQAGTEITEPRRWLGIVAWREYLRLSEKRTAGGRVTHDEDLVLKAPDPTDVEDEVLEEAEAVEIAGALTRALGRLSPGQRTAIELYAQGNTYARIAELTGLSPTGVNKAIVRAKRNLAQDGQLGRTVNGWRRP